MGGTMPSNSPSSTPPSTSRHLVSTDPLPAPRGTDRAWRPWVRAWWTLAAALGAAALLTGPSECQGATSQEAGPPVSNQSVGTVIRNVSRVVEAQFIPSSTPTLSHLVLDPNTEDLYVGAVNHLYQLKGGTLQPLHQVVTGPRQDSPVCHASGCASNVHKTFVNNYNKILVVEPDVAVVVACGSVSQGACDKYRMGNLSVHLEYIPRSVAANDPQMSTFAFVGPELYNEWGRSQVLYVGTTFTTIGDYRHNVPAISTRNLYDLDFAEFTFSKQSLLRIDVKYRDNFLVQYVYGFNASDYVHFLMVQKKSHLPGQEESGYVSRISRTCISDPNYDSYTEVTLECRSPNGTNYNLVQDAKVVVAGADLARSMGVEEGALLLLASFSPSHGHTAQPRRMSAICVYSVQDIEAKFNENAHMCFNGSMQYRNMEYISGPILDGKCPRQGAMGNILSFCEIGLKISGPAPVVARSALLLNHALVTGVQATATAQHTVAFLGTSTGTINKILLGSGDMAAIYEEIKVDPGSAILPDMRFSKRRDYLYVLSTSKVSKVKVESCSSYGNCSACLQVRDPYCGWCSLEKRCTVQSECEKATFSSPRWLSFGSGQQCIDFEKIEPDRIPMHMDAKVQLTIRTLPELPSGAKYLCVFGTAPPLDAIVTGSDLSCETPPLNERPPITNHKDHALVPLSVRSSETNMDFVSRTFAFYDCSRHTMCVSCVRSAWACNWCVYDNVCTHNASNCTGTVVSGENNTVPLPTHGASFCPQFSGGQTELLVADGARTQLNLQVDNLPIPQVGQLGFQCVVTIEGANMVVGARVGGPTSLGPPMDGAPEDPVVVAALAPAHVTSSAKTEDKDEAFEKGGQSAGSQVVVCEATSYSYEAEMPEYEAKVTLRWNDRHLVDTATLTLYKCSILGGHRGHQDCSLCVTRPEKYKCTWCGGSCTFSSHCGSDPVHLDCPRPRIDMIQPLVGPLEGGTLVTIEGSNLGLRKEDVTGNVYIGDVLCQVVDYQVSVKITCKTGPAPQHLLERGGSGANLQLPVRVTTNAGTTHSTVRFTYTNISVTSVTPLLGPMSGGTILSIEGRFLNVGSHVSATLDNLPCVINKTQSSSHRLVCITSRATLASPVVGAAGGGAEGGAAGGIGLVVRKLKVTVDGAKRSLPSPFTYTPDPTILELKPLKSPWRGGRLLTVHGTNLDAIQAPRMMVMYHDVVLNTTACKVLYRTQMECPSPPVDRETLLALLRNRREAVVDSGELLRTSRDARVKSSHKVSRSPRQNYGHTIALDVGFLMDNVAALRNLKHMLRSSARASLVYMQDPSYRQFPGYIKLYKGDTLVIEGENLNLASDESDVNVTIGTRQCNVTSLALTQLVCTPPGEQPPATDETGRRTERGLPLVVVSVGRNLRFPIGFLRYEMIKEYHFPPVAIGGMASGGLFLVLVSLVILVVYRRKSNQAEREYKRIQIQMDTLESNVRSECKQAFAELQTDITDLTADLESSGIPTLDLRTYVTKVFFPGVNEHPVLNDPKMRSNGAGIGVGAWDSATVHFEQLVTNRYFLLAFIDTLESQTTFNVRDKVNVASLLVVALSGKMEYLTEVLRLLLLRLVNKSVGSKHPQLMLRRTESVVEKMLTNWMALCMYTYLKDHAGPSLFLLFKAIKHQVEKGPVDAITHEARYSLSEERLLREQIVHSVVTIHLMNEEAHYEKIPYTTQQAVLVVGDDGEKAQCRVLDCDSINQVKAKILDALYRNTPHSLRPSVNQVDLEWRHGRNGHLILAEYDMTTKEEGSGWRRVNTLAHYGVKGSALMALVPSTHAHTNANSYGARCNNCTTTYGTLAGGGNSPSGSGCPDLESGARGNTYHLVKPVDHDSPCRGVERTHKAIPEIFLTRLLSTKGTVHKFVDDFFRTILSPNEALPPAVKWLFDFFDTTARCHGITDPEVALAWKSNSLPLRFWVNFIKNPDFILDMHKSPTVDSCLSVIAQTFMDACSTTEHRLGKDSPSNKLLFAKDMTQYRAMVRSFYHGVRDLPPVTDQDMAAHLHQLSISHQTHLDPTPALKELFHAYITKYYMQILEALELDPECRSLHLAHKLDNILCTLNGQPTSLC
ncbi:plexin-B-like isoform X2 [Oratosquilla oratoria]|uniref:plexin-B-like isoform X2 n=1 Tax=Oratosquilla oratoria TaxID=337810 RepID=UPI003F76BDCA